MLLSLHLTSLYMSAAQIVSFDAFVSSSLRIIGARSVFRNDLGVLPLCTGASRYTTIFISFVNLLRLLRVQLSIFLDTTAQNCFLRFIPLCRHSLSCCGGHAVRIRVRILHSF